MVMIAPDIINGTQTGTYPDFKVFSSIIYPANKTASHKRIFTHKNIVFFKSSCNIIRRTIFASTIHFLSSIILKLPVLPLCFRQDNTQFLKPFRLKILLHSDPNMRSQSWRNHVLSLYKMYFGQIYL